jgi:hypothetical protein
MIDAFLAVVTNSTTHSTSPVYSITETDVILQVAPYFLLLVALFGMRIWHALGGWPEAWYRIAKTPYFVAWFVDPSKEPHREIYKFDDITEDSPAGFDRKGGGRYFIDEKGPAGLASNGRLAMIYKWDESEPVPLLDFKKGKDGWDPMVVKKGFMTKIAKDMHRVGEEPPSKLSGRNFTIVLVLAIVVTLGLVAAYYSYNTYCALAPARCGLP